MIDEVSASTRRIVDELERAQRADCFDRLVLMAAPEFLGDLREVMPKPLCDVIALEIGKDLVHQDERSIRGHLPADVFVQRA